MDLKKIKEKLANLESKSSQRNMLWKPKPGQSVIRIVPYMHDRDMPFRELFFYYDLAKRTIISPVTFGEPDPVFEFAQKLKQTGEKEDYKLAKKLEPKSRTYVPIIVRGEESEGVKFFGFGSKLYTEFLKTINDPDYGDISDPVQGRDVTIEFTPAPNAQSFPETTIRVKPNITPVTTDKAVMESFKDMPVIESMWEKPTYEELQTYLDNFINNADSDSAAAEENAELESVATESLSEDVSDAFDKMFGGKG